MKIRVVRLRRARLRDVVLPLFVVVMLTFVMLTAPIFSVFPAQASTSVGTAGLFVPVQGRLVDSRTGMGLSQAPLAPFAPRSVQVTGNAGIPFDGVSAVLVAFTSVAPAASGQMSAGPTSDALAGVMRYDASPYTSNSAIVMVSEAGQISIQSTTTANVMVDVQGYYTAGNGVTAAGGYTPVTQSRIVDTVNGVGLPKAQLTGNTTSNIQVAGKGGVPSGATAVFVNFQVNNASAVAGYINPYATSTTSRPRVSLNFDGSPYTSIGAIVPLAADGSIKMFLSAGTTISLLLDFEGYFTRGDSNSTAGVFTPAVAKIYDTRAAVHVAPGATVTVPIGGTNDVPTKASGLAAITANLTVVDSGTAGGYARAYASGTTEPTNVGTLTFSPATAGTYTTNLATIPVGVDNAIKIHNVSTDTVDYILDLNGWYTAVPVPTITCPQPYQRGSWTQVLPTQPIACTVHLPATGDPDGTLIININLKDSIEQPLPVTNSLDYPLSIPAVSGWYDIGVEANYSNGISTSTHYAFGLRDGVPSSLVAAIQKVSPDSFQDVTTATTSSTGAVAVQTTTSDSAEGSATVSTSANTGVTLTQDAQTTTDPADGSTITTPATTIGMVLPFPSTASNAHVEANGIVSYNNNNGSSTVSIVKQDTSVQLNTIIQNATAPKAYKYQVSMPASAHLAANDDGSVAVLNAEGGLLGGIGAPWALDANKQPVPTHYEISGNSLTQIVDHSSANTYPVVADPWFGVALIQKVVWSYAFKNDPRLMVYPTAWGRIWAGPALYDIQWSEVISKTTTYRSRANTYDMKLQFLCHLNLGAQYRKSSYNLDTILHRGSAFEYTRHLCN